MWGNSKSSIEHLVPLYERSGVRFVLAGHEHNFQHAEVDGIHYFVTGGGGKVRPQPPSRFQDAHTVGWAATPHFLLVRIQGSEARVTPVGEDGAALAVSAPGGGPVDATTVIR
jgi:tartrate-resistant acid phosphatase type 5